MQGYLPRGEESREPERVVRLPKTTQPLTLSLSGGLPCPIVLYES